MTKRTIHTSTKTCLQRVRLGTTVHRVRRPHRTDGPTAGGYSECHECGMTVYVGQGELSPAAGQHREYLAAAVERRTRK